MNIYHYSKETHEYLGVTEARLDPLKTIKTGVVSYLVPANATLTSPPPLITAGNIACFENGVWVSKEDRRGETYYDTQTGAPVTIASIGAIPETLTPLTPKPCSTWDGNQWVVDTPALKALSLSNKLGALAAYRYNKETAGITVGGSVIKTDRESQAMISGAKLYADMNPTALIDWKGADGWVQIDRTALFTIGQAVGAHVQACFTTERAHAETIAALPTAAEIDAYDFTTGWPE